MKIRYTVHSVTTDQIPATVTYQGAEISAMVPVVTVELVSDDPTQSNPVLRLQPDSPDELAKWKEGTVIIGTFGPEKESSK